MSSKPIIAVIGATGAQGGGLVQAILAGDRFAARAITRHPDNEKGQALAEAGAEVVAADLDDLGSLTAAFEGAHGAYCVTNFWEHFSPTKEITQAKNLADAARAAGVQHVVWSTLEDTRKEIPLDDPRMPTLQGEYKVPHFDAKGMSDSFFMGLPVTCMLTSFYWDNLIHFGMGPTRGEDGVLQFVLPMGEKKMPGIAAADIGGCAHGIFAAGTEYVGMRVGIVGEHLTGAEMATKLGEALGEEVRHVSPPWDIYRTFDFPGADDLGNMFQYYHDCADAFMARRDVGFSRAMYPGLQDFSTWLERNKERIPTG
jgi:uncharacterized protein YbjT (DUF2867 family)